ncbi:MAG: dialkylresorcinol condensing enzyme [Betaproteobacteria bacterium]|nr:dialkylresorcinol condensing enzyme [Betaproteobacteria bacterium]
MKNVLVVSYSQSGQLADIVAALARPLETENIRVHHEVLQPESAFPFPWSFFAFFDAFPESVRLDPRPNKPLAIPADVTFDLVILAWTVWYLSPSQPMTAFLQSAEGKRLLAGRPVVSLVACRNMWISAFDTLKMLVGEAGGRLVDHIALTDESPPLATFITTPRWMLTGRRNRFFGLPPAGINARQTAGAARFGVALAEALARDEEKSGQPMLSGLCAVKVVPHLVMSERAARRAFQVWSGIIRLFGRAGQRRRILALMLFALYLIVIILTIVPLNLILQRLIAPLYARRAAAIIRHYEQPSGADDARMAHE